MRADHEATYRESYLSQDLSRGVIESDLHFKKRLHNAHSQDKQKSSLEAKMKVRTRTRCATYFPGRYREKCEFNICHNRGKPSNFSKESRTTELKDGNIIS